MGRAVRERPPLCTDNEVGIHAPGRPRFKIFWHGIVVPFPRRNKFYIIVRIESAAKPLTG